MIDQVIVTSEPDCCGTRLVTVRRGERAIRAISLSGDDTADAVRQCVMALDLADATRGRCDETHDCAKSFWCSMTVDGARTRFVSEPCADANAAAARLERALVARIKTALGVDELLDFGMAARDADTVILFRWPGTVTLAKLQALAIAFGTERIDLTSGQANEDPTFGDTEEAGCAEIYLTASELAKAAA